VRCYLQEGIHHSFKEESYGKVVILFLRKISEGVQFQKRRRMHQKNDLFFSLPYARGKTTPYLVTKARHDFPSSRREAFSPGGMITTWRAKICRERRGIRPTKGAPP